MITLRQPFLRVRPPLRRHLDALTGQAHRQRRQRRPRQPLFATPALERYLRPLIELVGRTTAAPFSIFAAHNDTLEHELALVRPHWTVQSYHGQQFVFAVIGFLSLPIVNQLGIMTWPPLLWIVPAMLGWTLPRLRLRGALRARARFVELELPRFLMLFIINSGAGRSPEQALIATAARMPGPLGQRLADLIYDASVRGIPYHEGLRRLASEEQSSELQEFSDAWDLARAHGTPPLLPRVRQIAASHADRLHERAITSAALMETKLLLPGTLFAVPAFLLIAGYPALASLGDLGN